MTHCYYLLYLSKVGLGSEETIISGAEARVLYYAAATISISRSSSFLLRSGLLSLYFYGDLDKITEIDNNISNDTVVALQPPNIYSRVDS